MSSLQIILLVMVIAQIGTIELQRMRDLTGCELVRADVVFILDESATILPEDYELQKEFLIKMVKGYKIGEDQVRVAVITFSTDAVTRFNFNTHTSRDEMIADIKTFEQQFGDTHTWEAIRLARNSVLKKARQGQVAKIVIVITDGQSQEPDLTKEEALKLRQVNGTKVFAIGIGANTSPRELRNIAGAKERIINVKDYKQLLEDEDLIFKDASCGIQIEDQMCGDEKIDIAFVMNTPNAGHHDLEVINKFTKAVVGKFEFGGGKIQVASITSECAKLSPFPFESSKTKEDVLGALRVQNSKIVGLKTLMEQSFARIFSEEFGARATARKVIILVTDGGVAGDVKSSSHIIDQLKSNNVAVFVMGVGDKVNEASLSNFATNTQYSRKVDSYEYLQLPKLHDDLVNKICKPPLVPDCNDIKDETEKRSSTNLVDALEELVERLEKNTQNDQ